MSATEQQQPGVKYSIIKTSDALQELWRYRYLVQKLVHRELKVRYKNSVFGVVWSIVPPLIQVLVYSFLIKGVLGMAPRNYSPYLLCGLIPWTFFSAALQDASQSILANYGIIKKVYMPREVIPVAVVLSNTIHFLISWSVFFLAFCLIGPLWTRITGHGFGIPLLPTMLLFPFISLMLLLLTLGLAFFVSALNTFYEDVRFIVTTLLNLLIFIFPILFPADNAPYLPVIRDYPLLLRLYQINPIAVVVDLYRKTLLQPEPPSQFNHFQQVAGLDWTNVAISFGLTLFIAYAGYFYFNQRKWQFVERN